MSDLKEKLSELPISELGALICQKLSDAGVQATLSGGACAQIYSNSQYVTGDLDFVVNYGWREYDQKIHNVMTELGFGKSGRIYVNESVEYSVEFPPGPLGIGDEYMIKPVHLKLRTGDLSLLSATDSAKDRLTGYFYANDNQCLEQALMICRMNEVDMENIRKWAAVENQPEKFAIFQWRIKEG